MVLIAIYQQIGNKLLQQLGTLRANQLELLNKAFKLIDSGKQEQAFEMIA